MTKVFSDSGVLAKLAGMHEPVILCDESGRPVGFFQPLDPPTGKGDDGREPPFSEEEVERFRQQRSGRPLNEILANLERLPSSLTPRT